MTSERRLTGKVALITGGGQGIGLGIAKRFASEDARLVLTGRSVEKLERAREELAKSGAKVAIFSGDVGSREDARKAVQAAVDEFGGLDILVNNAQTLKGHVPLEETDDEYILPTIQSGLFGTLYHMQAAFPYLKERRGAIINFGSRDGIDGGVGFGVYAATKEAIRGLSRVAAREWGKHGIRVNVICPVALSPAAEAYLEANPEISAAYLKDISLGYFGDPEKDIGSAALFLASEDSRYVTGQTLNVDGGSVML